MKTSKVFFFFPFSLYFFFFFFFSLSNTPTTKAGCSNYFCGNKDGPQIKFPFRILSFEGVNCGYPGFDLSCTSKGLTVLNLPSSQDFLVRHIDYVNQVIVIQDTDNCMPKRLLNLNLSGSPFEPVYYLPFTFFNCSSIDFDLSRFETINCLSSSNYTVLATSYPGLARSLAPQCQLMKKISVPMFPGSFQYGFESLEGDLQLAWGAPDCGGCAALGGNCGFKNGTNGEIGCSSIHRRGLPRSGLPRSVRYVISLGIGIPGIVCTVGIACYICTRLKARYGGGGGGDQWHGEFSSAVTPGPAIAIVGLDKLTIESYPKTVLGRSRRLSNPDENCCPICLSEYQAKEELRTIPDCKHSFHASCIDEWLRLNATCPLCRNSPMPIPAPIHAT